MPGWKRASTLARSSWKWVRADEGVEPAAGAVYIAAQAGRSGKGRPYLFLDPGECQWPCPLSP